jgi:hypothetical protein
LLLRVISEGGGPNEVSIPFALKDAGGRLADGDRRSDMDGDRGFALSIGKIGERRPLGEFFEVEDAELSRLTLAGRLAMWMSAMSLRVGDLRTEARGLNRSPKALGGMSAGVDCVGAVEGLASKSGGERGERSPLLLLLLLLMSRRPWWCKRDGCCFEVTLICMMPAQRPRS